MLLGSCREMRYRPDPAKLLKTILKRKNEEENVEGK